MEWLMALPEAGIGGDLWGRWALAGESHQV